ncbi:MAG: folate-binding protein [Propionibacteriaceae bacterium]|jgi:folate-binding protein YgfZ|nr:folate-binding protein [Propionibacteriaceae bacterium]
MTAVLLDAGPDAGLAWHHGDPLREQAWMEDGSGVVDLSSLDVLRISGADRLRYLHLLCTASVEGLCAGQSASAYFLDAHGRILWGLVLVETGEEVWAWTEPGCGAALAEHLEKMKFRLDVSAQVRPDMAVVWVGSLIGPPQAMGTLRVGPVVCRSVLGGSQIVVPRSQVGEYVGSGRRVGLWAYTALRIAEGIARVGVDTDERTIPNELGVPSSEVSVDKGCYPGQETVAKVRNLGAPPRKLVRLHLDGSGEELPEVGADVWECGADVGVSGSVASKTGQAASGESGDREIGSVAGESGSESGSGVAGTSGHCETGQTAGGAAGDGVGKVVAGASGSEDADVFKPAAKPVGRLGSVAYHHRLGPIGLALLDRKVEDKGTVMVGDIPATVEVLVHVEARAVSHSVRTNLSLGRR